MIKNLLVTSKQAVVPMLLGWILTCWVPVPIPIRGAATTAWSAVRNGVSAMFSTLNDPKERRAESSKKTPDRQQKS